MLQCTHQGWNIFRFAEEVEVGDEVLVADEGEDEFNKAVVINIEEKNMTGMHLSIVLI